MAEAGSRVGTIVFFIIGLVALAVGLWQGVTTARFVSHATGVTGHVVATPGQLSPTQSSAHPMIEFAVGDGSLVRYRQNGMGSRPIGSTLKLLYDPGAPTATAVSDDFWTLWFPVIAPLLLGIAFIALPLSGVVIGMRGARP